MNAPSVKSLMQIKDVTEADAQAIRAIMKGEPKVDGLTRMQRIDAILHTHGVEYIPCGKGANSPSIRYCNAGDTYATTVLKIRGRFYVGCWGDWVERGRYE